MPIVKKGIDNMDSELSAINHEKTKPQVNDSNTSVPQRPKYTLDDVIVAKDTKSRLLDALSFFKHQNLLFENWGLKETHKYDKKLAVNLYGPPGTGKTMAAHAAASYLGKDILEVSYADLESKYVGETPKNLEKVFRQAEEQKCVLFFDEADAILSRRVSNMSNSTDVSVNQTRSVILMLLNNFSGSVIFATNFVQNYDPAFMRRMLASIEFKMPDFAARKRLWEKFIPDKLPVDIDVEKIASEFSDISGSDISSAILNAALRAAREDRETVPYYFFSDAVCEIKNAKKTNSASDVSITQKKVSENYVRKKLSVNEMEGEVQ